MARRGRPVTPESSKQRDAFDYYYTCGEKRSFRKTAQRFKVTERTVANWAKKFHWSERINDIDIEVYDRMDEGLITSMAEVKMQTINSLISILQEGVVQKLKLGDIPFEIRNVNDVKTIIDLILTLAGPEPEEEEEGKLPSELKGMNAKDKADLKTLLKMVSTDSIEREGGIEEYDDPEYKNDAPFELE